MRLAWIGIRPNMTRPLKLIGMFVVQTAACLCNFHAVFSGCNHESWARTVAQSPPQKQLLGFPVA